MLISLTSRMEFTYSCRSDGRHMIHEIDVVLECRRIRHT